MNVCADDWADERVIIANNAVFSLFGTAFYNITLNIRLCKNYPKVTRRSEVRSTQYTVGTQYAVGVSAKKVNSHTWI